MQNSEEPAAAVPAVSIGLPVYNGERFLEEALRSVLAQTFGDFELLICDNASQDRTADICRDYAARDARIRYQRNARNLGAAPNYNLAAGQARGRYFKWLAHDDRLLPSYLARTVRLLDDRPDVVLCNCVVSYIDAEGQPIGLYDSELRCADDPSPARRFAWMVLRSHSCVDFFGLIRRSALSRSLLHASFHGADRALLAQLALRGRMVQLPAPLVEMREHGSRYTRSRRAAGERAVWHDAALAGRRSFPTWRLYSEYLRMLQRESLAPEERVRCYGALAQWWLRNWNAFRAGVDLVAVVAPGAPGTAERLKSRVFGAAPGHLFASRRR